MGEGGIPYDDLYREVPPKRGTCFRLQAYERGGISLVEVYKRVGKSEFYGLKKSRKVDIIILLIDSDLKDSAFIVV